MDKPQIHRFLEEGLNCSRGQWRLFVYKSEYNKLLKVAERAQENLDSLVAYMERKDH